MQLSQDTATSLWQETQFTEVSRDLLAGAPCNVPLAEPWKTTAHLNLLGLRAVKLGPIWSSARTWQQTHWNVVFVCLVRLNTTVQMSPRDDSSSSGGANTHGRLTRVSARHGLSLTILCRANAIKHLCRSMAQHSLFVEPGRRSAHETSTHISHTFTSDLSSAELADHTQSFVWLGDCGIARRHPLADSEWHEKREIEIAVCAATSNDLPWLKLWLSA